MSFDCASNMIIHLEGTGNLPEQLAGESSSNKSLGNCKPLETYTKATTNNNKCAFGTDHGGVGAGAWMGSKRDFLTSKRGSMVVCHIRKNNLKHSGQKAHFGKSRE